jgi:hypothetical protein
LPKEALPAPSSYEQIGHIAHFNLKPKHIPYKKLIGDALLETSTSIKTVVNKVGQVNGKYRTYECEILADVYNNNNIMPTTMDNKKGNNKNEHQTSSNNTTINTNSSNSNSSSSSLETTVIEDGVSIQLNVAECYWSTRLSGERQELIKDILNLRNNSNKLLGRRRRPLVIADVFCGTGAVCLLLAKKIKEEVQAEQKLLLLQTITKSTINTLVQEQQQQQQHEQQQQQQQQPALIVLANDWNQIAIDYMTKSIKANGFMTGGSGGGNTNTNSSSSSSSSSSSNGNMLNFELSCRDSYDFIS